MGQFIADILTVSLISGVLIFFLCTPLFNNRYKAKWKYWVWLIVSIRLIIPTGFALPQLQFPVEIPEAMLFLPQAQTSLLSAPYSSQNVLREITLSQVLFLIWIIGALLFVFFQLNRYFKTRKNLLRWSTESANAEIHARIKAITNEMGIKKNIVLLINEEITSPMIMGLFHPILILPHEEYNGTDLHFILRHEFTHYKSKDIIYKIVLFIANAFHWFNPAIYLMVAEAHADLEKVCDDGVMRNRSADERREYSEVILNSIGQRKMRGSVLTTHFYTNTKKIKERFVNIMDTKKKKSGFIGLLAVAVVAIMISAVNPVMGYATARDATNFASDMIRSYTFTQMVIDMDDIENLEINLLHGDIVVLINYELASGSQILISGTALGHTFAINQDTKTAYIHNNDRFDCYEDLPLFVVASGGMDWAFEMASIHLGHGNIWYTHTHIDEFLAKNLNISLPRGSVMKSSEL